jgi:hypothetical protein
MIIYIIHNPKDIDREPYIDDFIKNIKPHLEFKLKMIWSKTGKELTQEELSRFKDIPPFTSSLNKIKNASSLNLHHMQCLRDFIQSEDNRCMIVEDDSYITSINELIEAISHTENFDTIYLGEGCQPNIHDNKSRGLIPTSDSRCTECILYSKEGAAKILDYFDKTQENMNTCCHLDFFFNTAYRQIQNYKNFHYHPAPIKQATCTGKLKSTIQY